VAPRGRACCKEPTLRNGLIGTDVLPLDQM
jgi:hypothetical protein